MLPSILSDRRRTPGAPGRLPAQRIRWTAAAWIVVLLGGPICSPLAAQQARDPVLFVHGWRGDAAQWRTMVRRFRADGWTDRQLFAWDFDPRLSNLETARRISARVDQILVATGATRLDVVSHSMGSLSTRYYLRNLRSAGKVDAWVSLGGPNHGTSIAELCFSPACREMRTGSGFLAQLNQDDETPGAFRYGTWWSPCDEIIDPPQSVELEGAENRQTACFSHLELLRDSTVYAQVRDFISR